MMTANEHTSPLLVEMTSMSRESEEDLEESEEERQVLPFSTHLEYAKHWLSLLKMPLQVLLWNVSAFSMSYTLVYTTKNGGDDDNVSGSTIRASFTGGLVILATIFLFDAYVAFQGAQIFENQMMQAEDQTGKPELEPSNEENNTLLTSTPLDPRPTGFGNQKEFNCLAMSKSVDGMFGCESKAPSSTFLIGLLYALFAMALWGVAISIISVVYFQAPSSDVFNLYTCFWSPMSRYTISYSGEEYPITSLQKLPKFQNLPMEIQKWIKSLDKELPINKRLPFVELYDGSIAFPYARTASFDYNFIEEVGVAIFSSNGSGSVEYPFIEYSLPEANGVQLYGFPRTPPHHGWCGISPTTDPAIVQEEVLCYGNGTIMHFPGITRDVETEWASAGSVELFATDDSLWVAKWKDETGRKDESSQEHREIVLSLTSYSISNKERDMVFEVTHSTKPEHQGGHQLMMQESCHRPYLTVGCASLPVLMFLSFYLYQRDVPSSLVPMSVSFCLALGWILPNPWNSIVALLVASMCTCLIVTKAGPVGVQIQETRWKYISTEMLVWVQYALMGSVMAGFFFTEWSNTSWWEFSNNEVNIGSFVMVPCLTVVVAVLNAICLNHPIFELLAGAFAVLALGTIPMFLFKGAIGLTLPPLFLTLCFGCLGIGRMCRSSWLHTKVYCRRGWHHLRRTSDNGYEYVRTNPVDQSSAAL